MIFKSAQQAKEAGATKYFTGVPCKHWHVASRFVSGRKCEVCAEKMTLRWRNKNPENVKAWKHRDYWKNRDRYLLSSMNWQKKNPERANERSAQWKAKNPSSHCAIQANRRAMKSRQTPAWSDRMHIKSIYQQASYFRDAGHNVHVDHVIPLKGENVCGLHVHENLQILTATENLIKGNKFVAKEFFYVV